MAKKTSAHFKVISSEIAPAILTMFKLMGALKYYPKPCRVSKLTFLPTRSIFSLAFLPKVLEMGLMEKMQEVSPEETAGQMAYMNDRHVAYAYFMIPLSLRCGMNQL